ncbi:MAG: NAD(P)-binding domain-containing protein, partial [Flavobacteriales bacterium]|nr:NAD(P)-binding domain-containing protein [Flavobacteriales bacterium]
MTTKLVIFTQSNWINLIKKITLIGAGNVATHLGKAFSDKGFIINEVYSKSTKNAAVLATKLNATACTNIKQLSRESDVYIICIKDDFINDVATQFLFNEKIVVHTSGSVAMNVLGGFKNYGIFYPLQTFSKEVEVNINEVPFCIEANDSETEETLLS